MDGQLNSHYGATHSVYASFIAICLTTKQLRRINTQSPDNQLVARISTISVPSIHHAAFSTKYLVISTIYSALYTLLNSKSLNHGAIPLRFFQPVVCLFLFIFGRQVFFMTINNNK